MKSPLLSIEAALTKLLDSTCPIAENEVVGLDHARHRVTAEPIHAPIDVPPFTASAMDGYAVNSADPCFAAAAPYRVAVRGRSVAGAPYTNVLQVDTAARVFTGAMLPERADCVILQEDVTLELDSIVVAERPSAGKWVRRAGHDVAAGRELVPAGTRLRAFELGWLAACGVTRVNATRRVRVALFSTGDELREPGQTLLSGQIFESNRRVLRELLHEVPVSIADLGIVRDDEAAIAATLDAAATNADVVLTSGGVSVGDADHVRPALERVGQLDFWRLALKPGKPLAFGHIRNALFFGLPGNPVSTIVTFLLLVLPVIRRLSGATHVEALRVDAALTEALTHDPGRAEFQRGRYEASSDGYVVTPTGDQSSNRLASFRDANCLIHVPQVAGNIAKGDRVHILPFDGLLG